MSAPLVFMDTETTGLSLDDDIWEFAAIRREPDGTETELHLFIEHDREKCSRLPEPFREDHYDRFRDHRAIARREAAQKIGHFFVRDASVGKPHVVGAVPNFDTERLRLLIAHARWTQSIWHYHLIDVENLAVGYLAHEQNWPIGKSIDDPSSVIAPPWDSNELSRAVGVDPDQFERHTAMGDVRWAMAIYDAVMGGAR